MPSRERPSTETFGEAWERLFDPPAAHRGLWGPDGAPENSLAAFQAACAHGYAIELDVQLTADGEAVVFHDERLERMTGREGRLRDHTAVDLSTLSLKGTDETIPTLADALTLIGHRAMVFIELKTPFGEVGPLEKRVSDVLVDHNGPTAVIGFNPYSHAWFADHHPQILRGLNSYRWNDDSARKLAPEMRKSLAALEQVELARPDFLSLGLDMLPSARRPISRQGHAGDRLDRSQPRPMGRRAGPLRQPDLRGLPSVTSVRSAVRVHRAIAEIGKDAWDACAGATGDPFVSYDFLSILEESGCVSARTGWAPQHLSIEDEAGAVAGVMPLYLKSHSQGEYVFDHAWADAYERAGGRYYPKLQCSAPFSPVTGSRLIVRPDVDADEGGSALVGGALALCERMGASSLHVTFPVETEWRWMGERGMLLRQDQQYHWENRGYATFDDFLAALSANRRKTIRRERRDAQDGLEIVALTGGDLTEDHWDAFFSFYMDTGSRKWGRPYLNRRFFSLLGERMADKVLLIMARRPGGPFIAGALNLLGRDCLYGRHWGCVEDVPFLHFELCYYQAIEHAIRLGLPRVEAGAQGQHKIARGYLPSPVYSAHWIADPALREPVARYLEREREAVAADIEMLTEEFSPFREER